MTSDERAPLPRLTLVHTSLLTETTIFRCDHGETTQDSLTATAEDMDVVLTVVMHRHAADFHCRCTPASIVEYYPDAALARSMHEHDANLPPDSPLMGDAEARTHHEVARKALTVARCDRCKVGVLKTMRVGEPNIDRMSIVHEPKCDAPTRPDRVFEGLVPRG